MEFTAQPLTFTGKSRPCPGSDLNLIFPVELLVLHRLFYRPLANSYKICEENERPNKFLLSNQTLSVIINKLLSNIARNCLWRKQEKGLLVWLLVTLLMIGQLLAVEARLPTPTTATGQL